MFRTRTRAVVDRGGRRGHAGADQRHRRRPRPADPRRGRPVHGALRGGRRRTAASTPTAASSASRPAPRSPTWRRAASSTGTRSRAPRTSTSTIAPRGRRTRPATTAPGSSTCPRRRPAFRVPTPEDAGANPDGSASEYLPWRPARRPDRQRRRPVLLRPGAARRRPRSSRSAAPTTTPSPTSARCRARTTALIELEGLKDGRIFDPYTETWTPVGLDALRPLVPVARHAARRQGVRGQRRRQARSSRIYAERPFDSGTNVAADRDLRPGHRRVDAQPRRRPTGRCRCTRGCTCCRTATSTTTPAARSSTRWASPTTRRSGTSPPPTTRSTQRWTDLGVPGLGLGFLPGLPDLPGSQRRCSAAPRCCRTCRSTACPTAGGELTGNPGFRGSAFSIMLPLRPDDDGALHAGPSSCRPAASSASRPARTSPAAAARSTPSRSTPTGAETLSSRSHRIAQRAAAGTAPGVLLPTGEVMVFSGADSDEVVLPGTGEPVTTPELFDPTTETWRPMASQGRPRTYHNTAMLLPDGRVLVGGHAPISTGYAFNVTLPGLEPERAAATRRSRSTRRRTCSAATARRSRSGPSRVDTGTTFDLRSARPTRPRRSQEDGTRRAHAQHRDHAPRRRRPALASCCRSSAATAPRSRCRRRPTGAVAPAGPVPAVREPADRRRRWSRRSAGRCSSTRRCPPRSARAACRRTRRGQARAPFVAPAPQDVFFENLADAFGDDRGRRTRHRRVAAATPRRRIAPAWLVVHRGRPADGGARRPAQAVPAPAGRASAPRRGRSGDAGGRPRRSRSVGGWSPASAPAAAHEVDPSVLTVIDEVTPGGRRRHVEVGTSVTTQLVASNETDEVLEVLDDDGRAVPAHRARRASRPTSPSPSWYLTNQPFGGEAVPTGAGPDGAPRWARVSRRAHRGAGSTTASTPPTWSAARSARSRAHVRGADAPGRRGPRRARPPRAAHRRRRRSAPRCGAVPDAATGPARAAARGPRARPVRPLRRGRRGRRRGRGGRAVPAPRPDGRRGEPAQPDLGVHRAGPGRGPGRHRGGPGRRAEWVGRVARPVLRVARPACAHRRGRATSRSSSTGSVPVVRRRRRAREIVGCVGRADVPAQADDADAGPADARPTTGRRAARGSVVVRRCGSSRWRGGAGARRWLPQVRAYAA